MTPPKADNIFIGRDGERIIIQFTMVLDEEYKEPTIVAEVELDVPTAVLLRKKLEGIE